MAASTITFDTGEWIYIDSTGSPHTVTNGQTLSLTVIDGGASAVEYCFATNQSVTCTDGTSITVRPRCENASGSAGNSTRTVGFLTDGGQGSDFYGLRGELSFQCPATGITQHWTIAKMNPSDADFGSAGTITMTLEDQFGNVMVMPATGAGIDVGQAS